MDFSKFAKAAEAQFNKMAKNDLFIMDVEKDLVWDKYLYSFPKGTNPIYLERTEHDCNCCKGFIRRIGNVVAVIDGKLVSVWDVEVGGTYQIVADALSEMIKKSTIKDIFMIDEPKAGAEQTHQMLEDGKVKTWNHFFCEIPAKFVTQEVATKKGETKSIQGVFKRGLDEIDIAAAEVTLDLINQNSLYRGTEFKPLVTKFIDTKVIYAELSSPDKTIYTWVNWKSPINKLRNSSIGKLLQDITDGVELNGAVASFEKMVAPENYKRTSAPVTKGMVEKAVKVIDELGIGDSLQRRYAVSDDLSVNNVLFVDRSTSLADKESLGALLMTGVKTAKQSYDDVEEIKIDDFLNKVLPNVDSIEVLMKNSNVGNLVSLVAPADSEAPNILKWANNFSWSYSGDITDSSLKSKVKAAGGRVDGVFRFTHSWNELEPNQSLMDLHVFMPGNAHNDKKTSDSYGSGRRVGWNHRKDGASGGVQDVDYTDAAPKGYIPVENITFPDLSNMPDGKYLCKIHNWSFRTTGGKGKAEIEVGGQLYQYVYPNTKNKEWVNVATVTLKNGEFSIEHHLDHSDISKEEWGVDTEKFQKVSTIMLSPNYWDGQEVGNKHFFFMLDHCVNPDNTRGVYNEFLRGDLTPHRKVFELLGNKMKCATTDHQLSGLGFSSTKRDDIICKVSGSFTRTLKIKF